MRKTKGRLVALLALSFGGLNSVLAAPAGTAFSYQGELKDGGVPADGDYDFVFRLFDSGVGGSQIGADLMIGDQAVVGGLFTVELDFGSSAFAGEARWLEILVQPGDAVDSYATLSPRQPLTVAPYALFALNSPGDVWQASGADIHNTNAGGVGIGTTTPASLLHLSSLGGIDLTVDADTNNGGGEDQNARMVLKQDGGLVVGRVGYRSGQNKLEIMQEFADSLILGTDNTDRLTITAGGFVGVNRSTPVTGADYFSVQAPVGANEYGGMYIRTDDGSALPFYGYHTGTQSMWTYFDGGTSDWHLYNDGVRLTVTDTGRVGIGDTTPDANLEVVHTGAETGILSSGDGNVAVVGEKTDAFDGVTSGFLGGYYAGVQGSWEDDDNDDYAYGALGWSLPRAGVYATTNNAAIDAAYLDGDVTVTGTLSKGGGSFKIDHPLDPENKYLYHSFVESPDMKNIYDGNVTTDSNGVAIVTLPEWFEALNRDFRYQLTVIGQFAQAVVSEEILKNRFTIRTDKPNVKVSWQVTGIRRDAYANAHRIPVERDKPAEERGKYLHPEAFGKSRDERINHFDPTALSGISK